MNFLNEFNYFLINYIKMIVSAYLSMKVFLKTFFYGFKSL